MHKLSLILDGTGMVFMFGAFAMRAFRLRDMSALFVHTSWSKSERWIVLLAFALLAVGLYLGGDFPIVG